MKNKKKKKILIILTNIFLIILTFFIIDYFAYKHYAEIFLKKMPEIWQVEPYSYKVTFPPDMQDFGNYFDGRSNLGGGRKPDGLNYTDSMPLVIFGCSYAFGQYLNPNQTFSYKLSELLKRPVYNRSTPGASFSFMYRQALTDDFYKTIPECDTVIYIMMPDHARRIYLNYFDVTNLCIIPQFKQKKDKLILKNYNNKFLNFINSLYIAKILNHNYAEKMYEDPKYADKTTDFILLHFKLTKEELEKKWNKKVNFYVILYEDYDISNKDKLREKLETNGFHVISTKELTNENLSNEKYMMQDNHHPTEAAWDLLTPKIIEKLEL